LRDVWLVLRLANGEEHRWRLEELGARAWSPPGAASGDRSGWRFSVAGRHFHPGYHTLEIEDRAARRANTPRGSALVVSAPARSPEPDRSWGVFIPLYALRTSGDWGMGSFGDLGRLGRWAGELGCAFTGTLPLCAVLDDVPFGDTSPYMPASRTAWNDAYIDVESVPELSSSSEARSLVASREMRESIDRLRHGTFCDPRGVAGAKRKVLAASARTLCSGGSKRREEFEAYVEARPELVAYARFRAECERRREPFQRWPSQVHESLRDRSRWMGPGCDGTSTAGNGASEVDRVLVHLYAQWVAEEQLSEARRGGGGLHLDLPVGVHGAGFDPFYEPRAFAEGASAGAPPDDFFSGGQVWGFPPPDPHRIREDGYRYYIAALRHSMHLASSLRIDHVMGLHRMYWIAGGADARDGAYVRYKAEELHAVVSLEAHLAGTVVVGEDLGTVPGSVLRSMDRDGFLHSFVFRFRSTAADPLPVAPTSSMASLETHDLVPFAAYWRGMDLAPSGQGHTSAGREPGRDLVEQERQQTQEKQLAERARWRTKVTQELNELGFEAGGLDDRSTREALLGCLDHLGGGPASMVMVELEDLWLETESQNRPGTGEEAHNFVRRATRTLEELEGDRDVSEALELVDRARQGRSSRKETRGRAASRGGS
jgi:4-alpha-glucanotransferase